MRKVKLAIALQALPNHPQAYRVRAGCRAAQLLQAAGWHMQQATDEYNDLCPNQPLAVGTMRAIVETIVPSCSEIYALAMECHQVGLAIDGHLYGWPYHYEPAPEEDLSTSEHRPEQFHMGDALWSHTVILEGGIPRETLHHENIVEVLEEKRDGYALPEVHIHKVT